MKEATLLSNEHVLISVDTDPENSNQMEYIKQNFCGIVLTDIKELDTIKAPSNSHNRLMYLCGNIHTFHDIIKNTNNKIYVIKELSYNYENYEHLLMSAGHVPMNVNDVGVYFREFFDQANYFDLISTEHEFQSLTESNKPGRALRTGIYLSRVQETNVTTSSIRDKLLAPTKQLSHDTQATTKFNLLRCSTNLSGPTDNFRKTDNHIIDQVNGVSEHFFAHPAKLNHVLAQIYRNRLVPNARRPERKAKISAHSDKTKDMPRNGLMAFCTFYKFDENKEIKRGVTDDPYDYTYKKKTSVLTRLRFRLKDMVTNQALIKEFSVLLYPNSVFLMSLTMNRLYTHEIIPSNLPISRIPTRMGYVIRCSKTEAVYKDGQTYINENGKHIKLEKITKEDAIKLKQLYLQENATDEFVNYDSLYFSMNDGDYTKPMV
jgi:hypothetical protein